jgi:hypothetical protein
MMNLIQTLTNMKFSIEERNLIKQCLTDTYVKNERYLNSEIRISQITDDDVKKENEMIRLIHDKL